MRVWLSFILMLWGISGVGQAQPEPTWLKPSEAFMATAKQVDAHTVTVHFHIVPGYYLYQNRIKATVNGQPLFLQFPLAEQKEDPNFGRVSVYYHGMELTLRKKDSFIKGEVLDITWQGCAQQGVCYLPQVARFVVEEKYGVKLLSTASANSLTPKDWADTSSYQSYFAKGLGVTLLFFYLAGVGMAFTACMYPLIPIISALITGDTTAHRRGFFLSFLYVQAMACMYAVAGIFAALSGQLLAVTLQQPWVLMSLAFFFILMACAMLGFFQLQVPTRLQSWLIQKTQHLPQGKYISAAVLGAVSSLIIGPCMAPALAAALAYIGKEGNMVLGALALYILALGIGTPLIVIGMLGQRILPRLSPQVMTGVKLVFGGILLATALWIALPVLSVFWGKVLLGLILLMLSAVMCWQLPRLTTHYIVRIAGFTLAIVLLIAGILQLKEAIVGGQTGRPLTIGRGRASMQSLPFISVTSVNALQAQLALHRGNFILLDFYADWCISCQQMEQFTLQDPKIQAAMKKWVFLKADVTHRTLENQALLKAFGLYGPPAIIFFHQKGQILSTRVIGYQDAETFLQLVLKMEQGQ